MGLLREPALLGYVRAVGARLVAVSEQSAGPWEFEVVDQPEPNAFALPGGHVYVTRGLLVLLNSEDELAGVLGHEMAHVTARHSAKRMGAAVLAAPVSIATGLAGMAVGIVSPTLGSAVAGTGEVITSGLVIAPYSREQEYEADEIGQALAARAGYDPAAMPRFLETLDREVALLPGAKRKASFFDSHPQTPDRASRARARAQTLVRAAASPIAVGRAAFVARLDGLVVGPDPAQGVFDGSRFLHPDLGFAIDFPSGWPTQNTNEAAGALSPDEDAVVALQSAAANSSLDQLLAKVAAEQPDLKIERLQVNGLRAARTRLAGRGQIAEVTWIELGRDVYGVVGQCVDSAAKKYTPVFRATAGSFRAISASERRSIRESRLRVRAAQAGETPAAIAKRTSSTWDGPHVAVANGVAESERFAAGWPVKLALPQAYTPKKR